MVSPGVRIVVSTSNYRVRYERRCRCILHYKEYKQRGCRLQLHHVSWWHIQSTMHPRRWSKFYPKCSKYRNFDSLSILTNRWIHSIVYWNVCYNKCSFILSKYKFLQGHPSSTHGISLPFFLSSFLSFCSFFFSFFFLFTVNGESAWVRSACQSIIFNAVFAMMQGHAARSSSEDQAQIMSDRCRHWCWPRDLQRACR